MAKRFLAEGKSADPAKVVDESIDVKTLFAD